MEKNKTTILFVLGLLLGLGLGMVGTSAGISKRIDKIFEKCKDEDKCYLYTQSEIDEFLQDVFEKDKSCIEGLEYYPPERDGL